MKPALHVVGVRHHSPACARLVGETIREKRPRWVLVEGPADMNARMDELTLGHQLPFAIFSYASSPGGHYASWSPFCEYSPEWVAITAAREVGAEVLFMDLPAWHGAFREIENRYSDRHSKASDRVAALCERLGIEDSDALWDHMFEQPLPLERLRERLAVYFEELRAGEHAGDRDTPREAYMCSWIRWAMAQSTGDVVAVCGGFHAPVLARWSDTSEHGTARPDVPVTDAEVRIGSYLVPYSFHRLDSFVGYESGMPSPAFYQLVWETGADRAGEAMLFEAVQRLRKKKQRVSVADSIAAVTLARGLMSLRGHSELSRVDVLDGLAGALLKDALDAPLPWSRRGRILPRTDPMLVEMVAAFSGERVGRLAPGTPRPPLVHDAAAELERVGLKPTTTATNVDLQLIEPNELDKSRVLHRLRVLGVPGFNLRRAAEWGRDTTELVEKWSVQQALDADAALIEAATYGATLEDAAAGRLEDMLARAHGLSALAKILEEAALVGIHTMATRLAMQIRHLAAIEPSLEELGGALSRILASFRHDTLFGAAGARLLGEAIEAAFDRGLWLYEGIQGPTAPASPAQIQAVVALRDTVVHVASRLAIDPARALAVMKRRAHDASAPPALRGAALGCTWSLADPAQKDPTDAIAALRASARPEVLGDFLAGLFALAREELVHAPGLLPALDEVLSVMTRHDFLIAIPALRLAFGYFPPREKEQIARSILRFRGHEAHDARSLLHLDVAADITLKGMALEREVDAIAARYGLDDGEPS
jgi:hypothetical protein